MTRTIDGPSRKRIPVGGVENSPAAELQCFIDGQIVAILVVKHTVGKCRPRPDGKQICFESLPIRVHVMQCRALICESTGSVAAEFPPRKYPTVLSQPVIIVPIESPIPLYWYTMFASTLDAAATEILSLFLNSYSLINPSIRSAQWGKIKVADHG